MPPEENPEVQALGALWDSDTKCWYIDSSELPARYWRWLMDVESDDDTDNESSIVSSQAYVAATTTPCQACQSPIEVICIYCETGAVAGEPLMRFTVCDVGSIDDALARQLKAWPGFHAVAGTDADEGADDGAPYFANHCARCGAVQADMYLHSEPEQPFFDIPNAAPGSITLTPLSGTIQLSGDQHFGFE